MPLTTNVTHRNWTMVGALDSRWEAIVDPRGLVTAWFDGWSLDWWVRGPEGWLFPSRQADVRQSLAEGAPVVQTSMRLPGGEALQSVYAVGGDNPMVLVEVENRTSTALDMAFALRPYNPEGLAVVESISVEGQVVVVDGRPSLLLPAPPERATISTFLHGDAALHLAANRVDPVSSEGVRDPAGMIQAAFVYPLSPFTTTRAAMPLGVEGRRGRGARRRPWPRRRSLEGIPAAADVALAWKRELARGMQVTVPDELLQRAVDANRAYLLLFWDGDEVTPGPYTYHRFWFRDAAYQLAAMDRWGFHDESARVLRSFPRRQHADGFFYSQWQEWDSNGAAIWAIAEHYRLTGDEAVVRDLSSAVRRGAGWIRRKCHEKRRPGPELRGLLPAGVSAEHLGPYDFYYWDDFWGLRGLLDAALILRLSGDEEGARKAQAWAEDLRADLFSSLTLAAARIGKTVMPAGPTRGKTQR